MLPQLTYSKQLCFSFISHLSIGSEIKSLNKLWQCIYIYIYTYVYVCIIKYMNISLSLHICAFIAYQIFPIVYCSLNAYRLASMHIGAGMMEMGPGLYPSCLSKRTQLQTINMQMCIPTYVHVYIHILMYTYTTYIYIYICITSRPRHGGGSGDCVYSICVNSL